MFLIYDVSGVSFTFYFGLMGHYLLYCALCAYPRRVYYSNSLFTYVFIAELTSELK